VRAAAPCAADTAAAGGRGTPLGHAVTVAVAAVAVLLSQTAPGLAGAGVGAGPPVVYARR
jgi:hypothetical protein